MSQAQIAVMPDRASIFDPVFFSGDLETGEVLCVVVRIGLDLFNNSHPAWKVCGG